jgi:glutamate 5-kinase
MTRDEVIQARRIVIKIGSSSLTGKDGAGLDNAAVSTLVDAVAQLFHQERLLLV